MKNEENSSQAPLTLFDMNEVLPTNLGMYTIFLGDAFQWLVKAKPCSIHAVVTDPPYGLIEYTPTQKATEFIERELADLVELYFEQMNVFSALVGIYAAKALDAKSVYEKSRHKDIAQQRFPDLKKRGSGDKPSPEESLECKASKRPWAVQSHYDHPGWYMIWRYLVDPTCSLEKNRPVIIWRVDVVFIEKDDWKYEGSKGGRKRWWTNTYFRTSKSCGQVKRKGRLSTF